MLNTRRYILVAMAFCAAFLAGRVALGAQAQAAPEPGRTRLGVFSWQRENVTKEDASRELFDILAGVGASELYQYMNVKNADQFLQRAKELQIDVYLLAGRPEWALDAKAKQMLKEVDKAAKLMAQSGGAGLAGLMLDVEPYLTSAYKKDPGKTMETYLAAMRRTYARAQEKGVFLILCIPHFYDAAGYTEVLRALIQEASDAVAVMNYQKNDESGQIETELDAARQAGKRLIHIYELQRPGLYDLTERNTYYQDGLPAVWDSSEKLRAYFDYEGLSFALHDYTALREMISR